MTEIKLQSSHRGYFYNYARGVFLIAALLVFLVPKLMNELQQVYDFYGVDSRVGYKKLARNQTKAKDDLLVRFVPLGVYAVYFTAGFIFLKLINTFVYKTKAGGVFVVNTGGGSLVEVTHHFPFCKKTSETTFDTIVHIFIVQQSVSRVFNTGTMHFKLITFINKGWMEVDWILPAVANPFEMKKQIKTALAFLEKEKAIRDPELKNILDIAEATQVFKGEENGRRG